MSPILKPTNRTSGQTATPNSAQRLLECRTLLWLALPLALAYGCASRPNRAAVADSFTETPVAIAAPVSERQAANMAVTREVFELILYDTRGDSSMSASVDNGVVTLRGFVPNAAERKRIVDRVRELPGVNQVKDALIEVRAGLAQRM